MASTTTAPTRLWHPFAAMGKVDGHELVLTRGQGSTVWDADGNEYLDATAGLWFANVGHGRTEIADAVAEQLGTLAAHHVFGDHANPPALELAARVADLAPIDDAAVFFGSSGGEAIDTAAKIARRYWTLVGQPQRTVIVSRRFAYHGTNAYGTSLSGIPAVRDGYGTLIGDVTEVALRRPGRPRPRPRRARRPCRRVHRRADDRRRRRDPAARRLLAGRRGDLPRARRPPHLRRGDLRLRPPRPLVRLRALRLHARPHDLREGNQLGLQYRSARSS